MAFLRAPDDNAGMNQKTWLFDAEVAAWVLTGAILAFTLMLGHTLWKSVTGK